MQDACAPRREPAPVGKRLAAPSRAPALLGKPGSAVSSPASMEEAIPSGGNGVPPAGSPAGRAARDAPDLDAAAGVAPGPLERLASFRFTYLAFCVFVVLYVFSVRGVEALLARHFEGAVAAILAAEQGEPGGPARIAARIDALASRSPWVRIGGVRVEPVVLGADGRTVIYAPGAAPLASAAGRWEALERALLPARGSVAVSVPHNALVANGVLVIYAALLLTLLFVYTRVLTRRERERLEELLTTRDSLAERAARIEGELGAVRRRLAEVQPAQESDAAEIEALRGERADLLSRLAELERREDALRTQNARAAELQGEYSALEALLDEALADLDRKNREVHELQKQAKQRPRDRRDDEALARRLRTLYKNLELDERALAELVGLRDEALKLRAEESLKRLSDDSDHAAVRRKVGGLPPHLSIFELGFAGGGRIYYTKGRVRRFRVLAIGDKASQKRDLEYLSRLPREES
jgi:hypothetical protein